jgi:hypothetical protein
MSSATQSVIEVHGDNGCTARRQPMMPSKPVHPAAGATKSCDATQSTLEIQRHNGRTARRQPIGPPKSIRTTAGATYSKKRRPIQRLRSIEEAADAEPRPIQRLRSIEEAADAEPRPMIAAKANSTPVVAHQFTENRT